MTAVVEWCHPIQASRFTILIVEDEALSPRLIIEMLREIGVRASPASPPRGRRRWRWSPRAAPAAGADRHPPDRPDRRHRVGLPAARRIRHAGDFPVGPSIRRRRARRGGPAARVVKPFRPSQVFKAIERSPEGPIPGPFPPAYRAEDLTPRADGGGLSPTHDSGRRTALAHSHEGHPQRGRAGSAISGLTGRGRATIYCVPIRSELGRICIKDRSGPR